MRVEVLEEDHMSEFDHGEAPAILRLLTSCGVWPKIDKEA